MFVRLRHCLGDGRAEWALIRTAAATSDQEADFQWQVDGGRNASIACSEPESEIVQQFFSFEQAAHHMQIGAALLREFAVLQGHFIR